MPIGRYPTMRLAHRVKATHYGAMVESQYQMWPILIERPETGSRSGRVECGSCRASFTYRVLSAPATVKRRRLWLRLMIACFTLSATPFPYYLLANEGEHATLDTLLLVVAPVTALLGVVFLIVWASEDGLRGPNRFYQRRVHHISGRAARTQPPPPPKQVRPRTPYWNPDGPDDDTKAPR